MRPVPPQPQYTEPTSNPNPSHLHPPSSRQPGSQPTSPQPDLTPQQQKVLQFTTGKLLANFHFDTACLQQIVALELDIQLVSQLFPIVVAKYFKQQISRQQLTFEQIQNEILNNIRTFSFPVTFRVEVVEENEMMEQYLKIYTIKYSDRSYDALEGQDYFSNYRHLFTALKKYGKVVRRVSATTLQELVTTLTDSFGPTNTHISYKLDPVNLEICIDQLILENIPELKLKKQQVLSQIQNQLPTFLDSSVQNLAKITKQLVRGEIEQSLKKRQKDRFPLKFMVDNWVEVDFFFSSQKTIVKAIQYIEGECKENGHEILRVEGCLQSKGEQDGIAFKIRINQVCVRINFYDDSRERLVLFEKYINRVSNFCFGASLLSIIDLNKCHANSIGDYLRQIMARQSIIASGLNQSRVSDLEQFLQQFQTKEYQDSQASFQRSFFKDSSVSLGKEVSREQEKFKTQLVRPQYKQNNARVAEPFSSDVIRKISSDENNELNSEPAVKHVKFKTNQNQKRNDSSKKQKLRYQTQGNEPLKQTISFSQINPKFDEADIEDNTSEVKEKKRPIFKSIDISIIASKINQGGEESSRTTEGQCAQNILKQRVIQLEEAVRQFEEDRKIRAKTVLEERAANKLLSEDSSIKNRLIDIYFENITSLKDQCKRHEKEIEQFKKRQQILMNQRVQRQQYLRVQATETTLKEEIVILNEQIRHLQLNEVELTNQIKRLNYINYSAEQKSPQALPIFGLQLQELRRTIDEIGDNSVLLRRVSDIEQQLRIIKDQASGSSNRGKSVLDIEDNNFNECIKNEFKSQSLVEQWPLKKCVDQTVQTESTELQSQSSDEEEKGGENDEEDEEEEREEVLSCRGCAESTEKARKATRKVEYLTLTFLIVVFQVITLSFSSHIFS